MGSAADRGRRRRGLPSLVRLVIYQGSEEVVRERDDECEGPEESFSIKNVSDLLYMAPGPILNTL